MISSANKRRVSRERSAFCYPGCSGICALHAFVYIRSRWWSGVYRVGGGGEEVEEEDGYVADTKMSTCFVRLGGAEGRTAWRRRAQGARYIGKNYLFRSDKYFRTTRNRRILNGERRIYFQIWIDGKEKKLWIIDLLYVSYKYKEKKKNEIRGTWVIGGYKYVLQTVPYKHERGNW